MKKTSSPKVKSSARTKKPPSVKKSTRKRPKQKWGVFLNSRCVIGPFKATKTDWDVCFTGDPDVYFDPTGEFDATHVFNDESSAMTFVTGACAARKAIFEMVFDGDSHIAGWIEEFNRDGEG